MFTTPAITGNIDKIVFREIPESSNALALLQSGDIDIAYDLAGDQRQKIGAISGFRIDKTPGNFLQWLQFPFATTTNPQLLDLNVRQAIVNAIPYKDILDRAYLGYATQMICALAPIYPGYDVVSKAVGAKVQDLNKAKDFLSKSQYASGFDTTIHYDASIAEQEQIGVLIKAALAEIGINVTLIKQQDSDFVAQAFGSTGFPGMCLFMDMVGLPSPAFTTFLYFLKGHCCSPGGYQDTDINNLYAQQIASIGDVNKQIQLQAQIEDIAWNKDPTGAPLAYPGFQLSLQNKVSGWWWMSLDELLYQKAIKA